MYIAYNTNDVNGNFNEYNELLANILSGNFVTSKSSPDVTLTRGLVSLPILSTLDTGLLSIILGALPSLAEFTTSISASPVVPLINLMEKVHVCRNSKRILFEFDSS